MLTCRSTLKSPSLLNLRAHHRRRKNQRSFHPAVSTQARAERERQSVQELIIVAVLVTPTLLQEAAKHPTYRTRLRMTSRMGLTVGAVSVILSLITISHAFVTPQLAKPPCRAGPNFASSFDDDELSKLIGKRSQIRRKKKEELPSEDSVLEDLGLDEEAPIDLDKMPEFQTKRPVRAPKSSEEEKEEEEPVGRAPAEVTVTDYLADYEDENEFHIPNRIGISTRCWGDVAEGFVASGKLKKQQLREGKFVPGDLQVAFDALLAEGIVLFETSPEYGKAMAGKQLSAEDILARCIKENPHAGISPQIVGTYSNKIIQRSPKALTDALAGSCERMGVDLVDVYQVANLSWLHPSGGLVKGLTEGILEVGQANYAGVKNLSPLRMRRIIQKLDKFDLVLTSNSFEFSLTNRKNEKWITACKALGVIPLCRNPYDGGLASAQYTATNPSGGLAGVSKYSFSQLEKLQPLHSVLESVAEKVKARVIRENRDIKDRSRGRYGPAPQINTDITTAQVALNYIVAKGGVPLPEVNSPIQANEVIGCLGWTLIDEEVSMLESAADLCK